MLLAVASCARLHCNGTMCRARDGSTSCHLCGRADVATRAPTAEERSVQWRGTAQSTDYQRGVYQIGYVPSAEELSRAIW